MRRTLFLSRVAFVCNVFFALAVSLQLHAWTSNPDVVAFILMTGYIPALLFNALLHLIYVVGLGLGKKRWHSHPQWLVATNAGFLALQIIYILNNNDRINHS